MVRTDPALLETLLRNLIGNALRYTLQGYIAVVCREQDGWVRIEVEDSGVGIPVDKQTEIFREYHQLGNPERDGAKGLGLGLAIVERLARLLNHRIELRSAPGEGSCFTVVMPLGAVSAVSLEDDGGSSGETTLDSDLAGMTVLVIDDQVAVLEGMQALLGRWGCETILADSEEAAVAAMRQALRIPELIVSDYRLREGRTGSQAINRVRCEFGESIPALIITGDTAPERLREAQTSGHALMSKPVPPARLRAYLRTVRRNQVMG
jgi:CheY-like chemotaxis protein/anti-sigma regulatory factor (Ser/Thr protein kinase)